MSEDIFGRADLKFLERTPSCTYVLKQPQGIVMRVSQESAALLFSCSGFKSLAAHADHFKERPFVYGSTSRDKLQIIETLHDLAVSGLLIRAEEWLRELGYHDDGAVPQASITAINVITCDRPQLALNCVRSLADNLRRSGRCCSVAVYDDSVATATAEAIDDFRSRRCCPVPLEYFGLKQKEQMILSLSASVPEDVLRFGFGGQGFTATPIGANMNGMLARTRGSLVMSIDDDVMCALAPHPEQSRGLRVANAANLDVRVFTSRSEAVGAVQTDDGCDIASLHEKLLGRRVRDVILSESVLDLSDLAPGASRDLLRRGRVLLTMMGLAGDSGTSQGWIGLDGAGRNRLLAQARTRPSVIHSHEVLRSVQQMTITACPWIMTYACGLDNRSLLPPFPPIGRNMEEVFARVLSRSISGTYIGHLPWLVRHVPPTRDWRVYAGYEPRLADILCLILERISVIHTSPTSDEALQRIGRELVDIGRLPEADFCEWLGLTYFEHLRRQFQTVIRAVADAETEPISCWRDYCKEHLDEIERLLTTTSQPCARDLLGHDGQRGSHNEVQRAIGEYGKLMIWWPTIVTLASQCDAPDAISV